MDNYEIKDGVAVIPADVTEIRDFSFKGCSSLERVELHEGVKKIGYFAFKDCPLLKSIVIPASVTSIGWGVFENCPALESIIVEEGNLEFDSREGCNAVIQKKGDVLVAGCKNTVIPTSVTEIERCAFSGSGLAEILIPNSVVKIGGDAFANCTGLKSITIPDSVTAIVSSEVFGPRILLQPFNGCVNLTCIAVDKENPMFDSRENCNAIVRTCSNSSAYGPDTLLAGCATTVIPPSVKHIGAAAFARMAISEIVIPDTVESIGSAAFFDCSNLTCISLGKGLKTIAGRDKVGKIPAAFCNCVNLEGIVFPDSLNSIGEMAFQGCRKLQSIIIPAKTNVGNAVFAGCDSLISLVVEEGNMYVDSRNNCNAVIRSFDDSLVATCSATVIPETVVEIDKWAFAYSNREEITIPETVTTINAGVFLGCSNLKSVAILGPIKDLGNPFNPHTSTPALEYVTFGEGIKEMDGYILSDIPNLQTINVPAKKGAYYKKRLPEEVHHLVVEMEPVKKAKK
jgi:hypothetical protein